MVELEEFNKKETPCVFCQKLVPVSRAEMKRHQYHCSAVIRGWQKKNE